MVEFQFFSQIFGFPSKNSIFQNKNRKSLKKQCFNLSIAPKYEDTTRKFIKSQVQNPQTSQIRTRNSRKFVNFKQL
jgi:cAMP phosphodiesterase